MLHKSSVEGWNLFVYTCSILFLFSCLLFWTCVFRLLECVFVYIFIKGVTRLVVELWNTAPLLYIISCDLTNWNKIDWPVRDPFRKRETEQRAGLFLFCINNYCKKGYQFTNSQSWLSDLAASLVMQTSEIIGSPFIFDSQKRTEIGETCQNRYREAR